MAKERQPLQWGWLRGSIFKLALALIFIFPLTACLRSGVYHQVEPGQTLYSISKTYNIEETYLARINGIPNPTQLRIGTRIFIPGATTTKYVPATVPRHNLAVKEVPKTKVEATTRTSIPKSKARPKPKANTKPIVSIPPKYQITHSKLSKVNVKLHWPLRGKILRAFGQSGKGGGKGLEIAAKDGTKVSAAAAGKVIYSGDGVQGFGHLMILQHENDVFTVYGFNSINYVKQGQFVSQGEKIASSGRPPSGEDGRLHFEVRIGKQAVDPILYLP